MLHKIQDIVLYFISLPFIECDINKVKQKDQKCRSRPVPYRQAWN